MAYQVKNCTGNCVDDNRPSCLTNPVRIKRKNCHSSRSATGTSAIPSSFPERPDFRLDARFQAVNPQPGHGFDNVERLRRKFCSGSTVIDLHQLVKQADRLIEMKKNDMSVSPWRVRGENLFAIFQAGKIGKVPEGVIL
jgi:hypothetical protein